MLAHRTTALFATVLAVTALADTRAAASLMTPFGELLVFEPVEWKIADGGNGHSYALVPGLFKAGTNAESTDDRIELTWPDGTMWIDTYTWAEAEQFSTQLGGHLATLTSPQESDFVVSLFDSLATAIVAKSEIFAGVGVGRTREIIGRNFDYWLGGYQDASATSLLLDGSVDPASGWQWVTGEPFDYTNWYLGEPNDYLGTEENYLHAFSPEDSLGRESAWNDNSNIPGNGGIVVSNDVLAFVVEIPIPEPATGYLSLACLIGAASRSRR